MGRTQIWESGMRQRRNSFSLRASKNKLSVVERYCPNCAHDRALQSENKIKCARCKAVFN